MPDEARDRRWTGLVGRHVVATAQARGHEVVVLSRSLGVDVVSGDGLADALAGVQTIVDVTNSPSQDERAATDFFVAAAGNLQRSERNPVSSTS